MGKVYMAGLNYSEEDLLFILIKIKVMQQQNCMIK